MFGEFSIEKRDHRVESFFEQKIMDESTSVVARFLGRKVMRVSMLEQGSSPQLRNQCFFLTEQPPSHGNCRKSSRSFFLRRRRRTLRCESKMRLC